jgi:polysaccharide export outer membrane protein
VKLIRESAQGEKKIVSLNLNDANVINSPYYQLQQNDIIYVTPNKAKSKNSGIGSETSLWFTSTSILVSLASLLYNILR